ncbi:MAG: nitroreductase family protein [Eubacteriales bacterium]
MDIVEAIKTRRSVRKYDVKRHVDDDLIKEVISDAGQAPSAHNRQPWRFIIFRDPLKKKKIAERSKWAKFFDKVPVGIIVLAEFNFVRTTGEDKAVKYYSIQDSAAAIQNLLLSAWNLGLGTCWIGDFDENQLKELFHVPVGWNPVGIIAMGYPHPEWKGHPTVRKGIDDILEFDD